MTRFNQFLILLVLLIFAACTKLALAADPCNDNSTRSLQDAQKLSKFLQMNEKHPEFMYHYNGVSVTKERFEQLMKEPRNKNIDPNIRLVNP